MKYPNTEYDGLIVDETRELDKTSLDRLMAWNFIDENKNLVITGPCGCDKTLIASSIGLKALKQLRSVRYCGTSSVIAELKMKEEGSTYLRALDQIAKLDLLILDDIGLMNLDIRSCRMFFEVLDLRNQNGSVIFLSQYPVNKWFSLFEITTYADTALSEAIGKAYRLDIKGKDYRK